MKTNRFSAEELWHIFAQKCKHIDCMVKGLLGFVSIRKLTGFALIRNSSSFAPTDNYLYQDASLKSESYLHKQILKCHKNMNRFASICARCRVHVWQITKDVEKCIFRTLTVQFKKKMLFFYYWLSKGKLQFLLYGR